MIAPTYVQWTKFPDLLVSWEYPFFFLQMKRTFSFLISYQQQKGFKFNLQFFLCFSVHTSICISVKVEMLVAALSQQVCVWVCVCLSTHSAQCYLNSLALKHSIIGRKLNVLYLPQPASGAVYIGRHHQLYHVCSSTFTLHFWCLWHLQS